MMVFHVMQIQYCSAYFNTGLLEMHGTMFCGLVIFIKHFDLINIRRPCAHKITMFCSEVKMIKSFNPIKSRRPWPPISISHLFQQRPFSSWPLLFTPGVFLFRYIYTVPLNYNFKTTRVYTQGNTTRGYTLLVSC